MVPATNSHMDCSVIRASISARLDDESAPVPESVVSAHLDGCARCCHWSSGVTDLHRSLRVVPAAVETDRTEAIMSAIERRPVVNTQHDSVSVWRLLTVLIALIQIVAAVPLLLGHGDEMHGHFARHVGVFAAALAVGLLMAAHRPDRARSLLPVLAVLVAGLVWSCLDDLLHGMPVPGSAIAHGADVIALFVVWQLAHLSDATERRVGSRSPVLR